MAIPQDMEQVNIIIEREYARAVVEYGRTDGRRLSKSAAAREIIIAGLRALSFLPMSSAERTNDVSPEQVAA